MVQQFIGWTLIFYARQLNSEIKVGKSRTKYSKYSSVSMDSIVPWYVTVFEHSSHLVCWCECPIKGISQTTLKCRWGNCSVHSCDWVGSPCNLPGLYSANYALWSCLDISDFGQVVLFNLIEQWVNQWRYKRLFIFCF